MKMVLLQLEVGKVELLRYITGVIDKNETFHVAFLLSTRGYTCPSRSYPFVYHISFPH